MKFRKEGKIHEVSLDNPSTLMKMVSLAPGDRRLVGDPAEILERKELVEILERAIASLPRSIVRCSSCGMWKASPTRRFRR